MAVKDDNKRISLTLSKELDEKIDKLAGLQNISKNATIVNLIEMSIDAQISLWNLMKDPKTLSNLMDMAVKMNDPKAQESMENIQRILSSSDDKDIEKIKKTDQLYEELKK